MAQEPAKPEVEDLRKHLADAVERDFEIVQDRLRERSPARGGGTYWLVHLKPKRAGHYALKHACRYTHGHQHPEEGEDEIFIRVGETGARRDNLGNLGLGNVCLGDTLILPVRVDQTAEHRFSLESRYEDGAGIGREEPSAGEDGDLSPDGTVANPLEAHLEYLGAIRSTMPHRSVGGETVVHAAVFKAKSVGRFNLGLSAGGGGPAAAGPGEGLPVIVVAPGTPVTALAYHRNTVRYSDNRRFAAHSGDNYMTRLLILQPGDVFTVEYATLIRRRAIGKTPALPEESGGGEDPKPAIQKLPFAVDADFGCNEWLIDHLPAAG